MSSAQTPSSAGSSYKKRRAVGATVTVENMNYTYVLDTQGRVKGLFRQVRLLEGLFHKAFLQASDLDEVLFQMLPASDSALILILVSSLFAASLKIQNARYTSQPNNDVLPEVKVQQKAVNELSLWYPFYVGTEWT